MSNQILILHQSYQWVNLGKLNQSTPDHVEEHT